MQEINFTGKTKTGTGKHINELLHQSWGIVVKIKSTGQLQVDLINQLAASIEIDSIPCKDGKSTVLFATINSLEKLTNLLKRQPDGLPHLAKKLASLIDHEITRGKNKAQVMGILNITPDSFSDGGSFYDGKIKEDAVIKRIEQIAMEGADYIDIGGVSTRPQVQNGQNLIPDIQEELNRVLPVVKTAVRMLEASKIRISVDTFRAGVAKQCLDAGANLINDQHGLEDIMMLKTCTDFNAELCIMHYNNSGIEIMEQIHDFFYKKINLITEAGFNLNKLLIDPGFGFAKSLKENYTVLNNLHEFTGYGCRVLAGVSRKSMLGNVIHKEVPDRLYATLAAETVAVMNGADVIRTHNVAACLDVINIVNHTLTAEYN